MDTNTNLRWVRFWLNESETVSCEGRTYIEARSLAIKALADVPGDRKLTINDVIMVEAGTVKVQHVHGETLLTVRNPQVARVALLELDREDERPESERGTV